MKILDEMLSNIKREITQKRKSRKEILERFILPLSRAIFNDNIKDFKEIIHEMICNKDVDFSPKLLCSLIEFAIKLERPRMVEFLISNCNIIPSKELRDELLWKAYRMENNKIVAYLLSTKWYIMDLDDILRSIMYFYDMELLSELLKNGTIGPMWIFFDEHTFLDLVILNGATEHVELFKNVKSNYKESLEMANFRNQIETLKLTSVLLGVDRAVTLIRPDNKKRIAIADTCKNPLHLPNSLLKKGTFSYFYEKILHENNKLSDFSKKENKELLEKEQAFKNILIAFEALEEYCYSDKTRKEAAEILFKPFQTKKNLVIIPSSIENHMLSVALIGNFLIYSNRGESKKLSGVFVFKIKDSFKVDSSFILSLQDCGTILSIETKILDVVNQDCVVKIPSKFHKRGTCSFSNPKSLVEGILFVYAYMRTGNKIESLAYAEREQKKYTTFLRDNYLEFLLSDLKDSIGEERTWRIKNLREIIEKHHAELSYLSPVLQARTYVPRAFKLKKELQRELRILSALNKEEREQTINLLDKKLNSGLLIPALKSHDLELSKFLILHGADIDKRDRFGLDAFELAKALDMSEILRLLEKNKPNSRKVKIKRTVRKIWRGFTSLFPSYYLEMILSLMINYIVQGDEYNLEKIISHNKKLLPKIICIPIWIRHDNKKIKVDVFQLSIIYGRPTILEFLLKHVRPQALRTHDIFGSYLGIALRHSDLIPNPQLIKTIMDYNLVSEQHSDSDCEKILKTREEDLISCHPKILKFKKELDEIQKSKVEYISKPKRRKNCCCVIL